MTIITALLISTAALAVAAIALILAYKERSARLKREALNQGFSETVRRYENGLKAFNADLQAAVYRPVPEGSLTRQYRRP